MTPTLTHIDNIECSDANCTEDTHYNDLYFPDLDAAKKARREYMNGGLEVTRIMSARTSVGFSFAIVLRNGARTWELKKPRPAYAIALVESEHGGWTAGCELFGQESEDSPMAGGAAYAAADTALGAVTIVLEKLGLVAPAPSVVDALESIGAQVIRLGGQAN